MNIENVNHFYSVTFGSNYRVMAVMEDGWRSQVTVIQGKRRADEWARKANAHKNGEQEFPGLLSALAA